MEFSTKLKLISGLGKSTTLVAIDALKIESKKQRKILAESCSYNELDEAIEIVNHIGHRDAKASVDSLIAFNNNVLERELIYSSENQSYGSEFPSIFNAYSLIGKAIEALGQLRYFEPRLILNHLIELSGSHAKEVATKSQDVLKKLASYDIHVYYGSDERQGIGAWPQQQIIEELVTYSDQKLVEYLFVIADIVDRILSLEANGVAWRYDSATISKGLIHATEQIRAIRKQSVDLLKKLYGLSATIKSQIRVVSSLNAATRIYGIDQGDDATVAMVEENTIEILDYFHELLPQAPLQVVQRIERDSYWIYFHSRHQTVKTAARRIEQALSINSEYNRYKALIGFEGVFSAWDEARDEKEFEKVEKLRKEKAIEFVAEINEANFEEWKERLLRFAKTESDDLATFPTFFFFLEQFARKHPELAFRFVREEHSQFAEFLIPLLRGLWSGKSHDNIREQCREWIAEGMYLSQTSRIFLEAGLLDMDLLHQLISQAGELRRPEVLASIVSVATANYATNREVIKQLFIPSVQALSGLERADWVYDFWYRSEAKELLKDLSPEDVDIVLDNILLLKVIDYQAEEVLYLVASRHPEKVFDFLMSRLDRKKKTEGYEAIPFVLHKLNEPLSKISKYSVDRMRASYRGSYWEFVHGGARLLKVVFPDYSVELESHLIDLVKSGSDRDISFVLAILRNYDGATGIHKTCLEIVKKLPIASKLLEEVEIVLEGTGVVHGEFGLAEAFERKREQLQGWLTDQDENVQFFARSILSNLEAMSIAYRKRAQDEITLRNFRYGDSED